MQFAWDHAQELIVDYPHPAIFYSTHCIDYTYCLVLSLIERRGHALEEVLAGRNECSVIRDF